MPSVHYMLSFLHFYPSLLALLHPPCQRRWAQTLVLLPSHLSKPVILIPLVQLLLCYTVCVSAHLRQHTPSLCSAVLFLLFVTVKCTHRWLAAISGGEDKKKIWQKMYEIFFKFASLPPPSLFHFLLSFVPCLPCPISFFLNVFFFWLFYVL